MITKKRYTQEQKDFIAKHYDEQSYAEMAIIFNNRFNENRTSRHINLFCARNKLKRKNRINSGCFKKGCKVWNAGLKGVNGISSTIYKRGNTPQTWLPIGSEAIRKNGNVRIKIYEPNVWQEKSHFIWEWFNGKIPKNHVVVFLDNNNRNFDIDNLKLLSRQELGIINKSGINGMNSEEKQAMISIAKIGAIIINKIR